MPKRKSKKHKRAKRVKNTNKHKKVLKTRSNVATSTEKKQQNENGKTCMISYMNGHNMIYEDDDDMKIKNNSDDIYVNVLDMGMTSLLKTKYVHKDTQFKDIYKNWSEEFSISMENLKIYYFTARKNRTLRTNREIKLDLNEDNKNDDTDKYSDDDIKTHKIPNQNTTPNTQTQQQAQAQAQAQQAYPHPFISQIVDQIMDQLTNEERNKLRSMPREELQKWFQSQIHEPSMPREVQQQPTEPKLQYVTSIYDRIGNVHGKKRMYVLFDKTKIDYLAENNAANSDGKIILIAL
eukprot:335317_1